MGEDRRREEVTEGVESGQVSPVDDAALLVRVKVWRFSRSTELTPGMPSGREPGWAARLEQCEIAGDEHGALERGDEVEKELVACVRRFERGANGIDDDGVTRQLREEDVDRRRAELMTAPDSGPQQHRAVLGQQLHRPPRISAHPRP